MIPTPTVEYGRIPSSRDVMAMTEELAAAARKVHSEWEQDIEGFDEELGMGGICQDVADAMIGVLCSAGVENAIPFHGTVGENHVWVVALLSDGVYSIDIPPHVYETGSGYVWRKRHDAVIGAGDVTIDRIGDPVAAEAFEKLYCE